jgi:cellulose biosynthesis protein BcsQ
MECGLGSPEQIAACIHIAQRWFQVLVDIAGLSSLALITLLIWLFQRLRKDLTKWEDEAAREKEMRNYAENSATEARHRADLADSVANRAQKEKNELEAVLHTSSEELRKQLGETQGRLSEASARIESALEATAGGTGKFWSRPVYDRFNDYERQIASSIPILLFGNQKGGVGKSTLVTNLAAAFANKGERVLTVDLDYQGSHSSLAQLQMGAGDEEPESLIDFLFQDELDSNWPMLAIRRITGSLHYIPAFYNFELLERRLEYRWALGVTKDDVRYRLSRALLSETIQSVEQGYDRILIDAPPRFTLGFINGLCTSTHLYVPTVVDLMSTSAVSAFARQFSELKPIINPHIRWSGIIGTITFVNPRDPLKLTKAADDAATAAERAAQNRLHTQEPLFIRKPVIKRDADLARATELGIAYLNDSTVRPMFDALALEIEAKAPSRKTRR